MIPTKKKTQEELAALRGELGLFPNQLPQTETPSSQPNSSIFKKVIGQTPKPTPPPRAEVRTKKRKIHTLRKIELPLAPAPVVENKTPLPDYRQSQEEIAEIRRREALANFSATPVDPIAHLKKLTAHPILLTFAYLPSFAAIYAAWETFHYITPISLIFVSGLLTAYIFWRKKRSRHHAAILFIILVMTLVFGGIHYAPLFKAYAS